MLKKICFLAALLSVAVCHAQVRITYGATTVNYQTLNQPDVAKELKLTDDQKDKIAKELKANQQEVQDELSSLMSGGSHEDLQQTLNEAVEKIGKKLRKKLEQIMSPGQLSRFDQVELQIAGLSGLSRESVVKAVGLTKDQQDKISQYIDEMSDAQQGIMENAKREEVAPNTFRLVLDPEDEKKLAEMNMKALEKAVKLFSDEQKKKWEALIRPTFVRSK